MNDSSKNAAGRRKGYYKRQIELEAERQGLTVEEYGVYKGSDGSLIKPINSTGGLLFLAILISAICSVVFVLGLIVVSTPGTHNWVQVVIAFAVALLLPPTAWSYYFKERKASRLRRASGKTVQPPTRRAARTDW
jgi:hypothetical protein